MAINSQKLLPGSIAKGGALAVVKPSSALVPTTTIVGTKNVSSTVVKKKVDGISKKVNGITFVLKRTNILRKRILQRQRRAEIIKKRRETEERLEQNNKQKAKKSIDSEKESALSGELPFMDGILRFGGFTLLGFVVNNYAKYLPKLQAFGKTIEPVAKFFGTFVENIVGNVITFVERGYKAYDFIQNKVKEIGGENVANVFNGFSSALNAFLQASLLIGVAGMGGGLIKPESIARGAGATGGGLTASQRRKIALDRRAIIESQLSRRGVAQDRLIRNAFRLRSSKTTAQQEALAEQLLEDVFGKRERVTTGQGGQYRMGGKGRFLVLENAPRRKILKGERDLLRKVTEGGFGGAEQTRTVVQKVFDTKRDEFSKLRQKPLGKVPITSTKVELVGDELVRMPAQQKRKISRESVIRNIKKGQPRFTPATGRRVTELAIPGLGRKTFPSKTADVLEWMAKNYGANDIELRNAFEDPDFYSDIVGRNRREMMRSGSGAVSAKKMSRKPSIQAAGRQATKRAARQGVKNTLGRIPIIGPLLDFAISAFVFGDPVGESAAAAIGAAAGAGLMGLVIGAGTFGLGAAVGVALGGVIGDILGRSLWQAVSGSFGSQVQDFTLPNLSDAFGFAEGGQVGRNIYLPQQETKEPKSFGSVQPQSTQIGSNIPLTDESIKKLYTPVGVKAILSASSMAKSNGVMGNSWGALSGAFIDMLLGQKPESGLGEGIGSIIKQMTGDSVLGRSVAYNIQKSLEDTANRVFGVLMGAVGISAPRVTQDSKKTDIGYERPIPAAGYRPASGGSFNVIQYITGDATHNNYASDHGGKVYHEHIAFATEADKERAKAALRAAGFTIGSEYRSGDAGYHGQNLAIDVPFYPNQWKMGYTDDTKGEQKFSADVRRVLGLGISANKPEPVGPQALAPNQPLSATVASAGLMDYATYETRIHERNIVLYQKELVLTG